MKKQESKPAGQRDVVAGQEADRVEAELSNIEDDFGKGKRKSSARKTVREVAKKEGQRDR
jgi:hypothetical protein